MNKLFWSDFSAIFNMKEKKDGSISYHKKATNFL